MHEGELRAIVREAVRRHLGQPGSNPPPDLPGVVPQDASHARFPVSSGAETDGPCLIEPAVRCNHCGYCQSYGH